MSALWNLACGIAVFVVTSFHDIDVIASRSPQIVPMAIINETSFIKPIIIRNPSIDIQVHGAFSGIFIAKFLEFCFCSWSGTFRGASGRRYYDIPNEIAANSKNSFIVFGAIFVINKPRQMGRGNISCIYNNNIAGDAFINGRKGPYTSRLDGYVGALHCAIRRELFLENIGLCLHDPASASHVFGLASRSFSGGLRGLNGILAFGNSPAGSTPQQGRKEPKSSGSNKESASKPSSPPFGRIPIALVPGLGSNGVLILGLLSGRSSHRWLLSGLGFLTFISGIGLMFAISIPVTWGWPI